MVYTQPEGFLYHSLGGISKPDLFKPQYTLKLVTGPITIIYSLYCSGHSCLQSVSIIYRISFVLFFVFLQILAGLLHHISGFKDFCSEQKSFLPQVIISTIHLYLTGKKMSLNSLLFRTASQHSRCFAPSVFIYIFPFDLFLLTY